MIGNRQPEHPWLDLTNEQFLIKAGFWRRDPLTGTEGYTLAAALMFGKEEVILQVVPQYRIDALVRRVDMDRYDDRVDIRCNLIDAYEQLMQFVAKHLPDPFHLEGDQRISLREKIFREVVSNVLVHREYLDGRPATFTVFQDRVEVVNAANPHGSGAIRPESFMPYAKNPVLCRFFRQIGRAEELGSGVLNVSRYLPFYAKGSKAQFVEGNPFVTIVPLPTAETRHGARQTAQVEAQEAQVEAQVALTGVDQAMLLACRESAQPASVLQRASGYKTRTGNFKRSLRKLIADGLLSMTIPDKPNSRLQRYVLTPKGRSAMGRTLSPR